jgi:hypothetical protein
VAVRGGREEGGGGIGEVEEAVGHGGVSLFFFFVWFLFGCLLLCGGVCWDVGAESIGWIERREGGWCCG